MRKAQIALEMMAFWAVCAIGFIIVMLDYYKGALQGNWRANVDSFSEEQFEQGHYGDSMSITFESSSVTRPASWKQHTF
ncbi:MAG: hypothetical protein KKC11_05205 [Candidatus Omnitrophica bacterium]|nr:hypothetical protein [Candidatus Omnitrophota bacterium]MBU0878106.1 hypothetical protein [Candidatus Omnitrophota bacterium]MBU0897200.1 hypothetical protein [Candidatus Omnitrophota bacterium]MBU1133493.1 hypothetical protein [Candidatus Omnitrophota bacterium]MBU1366286.1 hypothetical protein [Candidatus Omnitrophota bacterium]